jgi:signal transduction histidine kinase
VVPADVFQLIVQTSALVRGARDVDKALLAFLRATHRFLGADSSCIVVRLAGDAEVRLRLSVPREEVWDRDLLHALVTPGETRSPLGVMSARIERRDRDWGVLVVRRRDAPFSTAQRHALLRIASEMSEVLRRIDRERLVEVRQRIDFKILRDLAPKDLYYQILDGLHLLTSYTHSASLHILDRESAKLELVAEQVAWKKMKSPRIGRAAHFPEELVRKLDGDTVLGFDFLDGDWREWTSEGAADLARALDPADPAASGETAPPMGAMLCAALGSPTTGLAVLQLGSLHAGSFGSHELEIVRQFVPAMSVAIERAQAGEKVRRQVLAAERHAVFAHLARGVAHDVNNALGSVLPLVQQIRADLDAGKVQREVFAEDMREIENSLEVCRRIFAGMLRWARGSSTHGGACDAPRAVRNAVEVLDGMMRRSGVMLDMALEPGLPSVRGSLAEMEQLFLNLATNAIEAMPRGGTLRIRMEREETRLKAEVEDTGRGIEPEKLGEIEEPFVTTKENGTGLGLPTCRSILSAVGGDMRIESEPGRGTRVTVRLRLDDGRGGGGEL